MLVIKKVGIISCSGEEYAGGGISRLAARQVLEQERPGRTVTICLPLFLAGGEEERFFAKNFPTVTLDGCAKRCAYRATEKLSGQVTKALVVSDLIGEEAALQPPFSQRHISQATVDQIGLVKAKLVEAVDDIMGRPQEDDLLTPKAPPSGIRLL